MEEDRPVRKEVENLRTDEKEITKEVRQEEDPLRKAVSDSVASNKLSVPMVPSFDLRRSVACPKEKGGLMWRDPLTPVVSGPRVSAARVWSRGLGGKDRRHPELD